MPKKQKERKGKKQRKKHSKKLRAYLYEAKDEKLARKRRNCPKCGPAVFMAEHKDRVSCGKCGYTEFNEKKGKE